MDTLYERILVLAKDFDERKNGKRASIALWNELRHGPIEAAFYALSEEQERIDFCVDLLKLWMDKDRKEEARKIFCEIQDNGKTHEKRFKKNHGKFWGMSITTQNWHGSKDIISQLRIWVDPPSHIGSSHVDSGGNFVLIHLNAKTEILKEYWDAFKNCIREMDKWYREHNVRESKLSNGVILYTYWISG
jgi:hypothetical protein